MERTIPLRVSIITHNVGFQKLIKKPLNLGISVGTSLYYVKGKQNGLGQDFDLTWYNHKELGQGFMLNTSVMYDYIHPSGFMAKPKLSMGYLHTFNEKELFTLSNDGTYQKATDIGRSSFMVGIGGRLGFDFGKISNSRVKPFIEYDLNIQVPHSQFVPIFPHSFFYLGAEYSITQNKN